jgi:hypothetical protein
VNIPNRKSAIERNSHLVALDAGNIRHEDTWAGKIQGENL